MMVSFHDPANTLAKIRGILIKYMNSVKYMCHMQSIAKLGPHKWCIIVCSTFFFSSQARFYSVLKERIDYVTSINVENLFNWQGTTN